MDFGGGDEIRFERLGKAGVITLTRPKSLNALTARMVAALSAALAAWEADADVELVVVKAEGRAFCAGGDLHLVYEHRNTAPAVAFFADEYRLNARIAHFSKPYVAMIDGIVMGGGVGVSFHGSHRVMTENAQFAMPEVGIGFFPDVGGSYLLSRLPDDFGVYLGLTGKRLRWGDALWAGLATHAVAAADLDGLLTRLCQGEAPQAALRDVSRTPARETDDGTLHLIARCFSAGTVEGLAGQLAEMAAQGDAFAASTLAAIEARSPTSLNVALRQIGAGSMLDFDECMRMEFRIVNRMLAGHDFYEGIRTAVIDKGDRPRWRPSSLAEVEPEAVESYFAPLPGGDLAMPERGGQQ